MYKLNFELVPDGCWKQNLRAILSKKQWEFLSKDVKRKANGRCMICGKKTTRLEAHEKWSYDEKNAIQKLENVVAICKDCHSVIHIGRTQLFGDEERAEKHFMKVNDCTYADYRKVLGQANENHKRLNLVNEWALDLTWLKHWLEDFEIK